MEKENLTGTLFRNSRGNPWKKTAIKCRMNRISEIVDFRCFAYAVRHIWATDALTKGQVDPLSVAELMGHKDVIMVSRVYGHLTRDPSHLRRQVVRAA